MKLIPMASACLVISGLVAGGSFQDPRPDSGLTPEQEEILSHLSIVHRDDGQGGKAKTLLVRGVDVEIADGDLIRRRTATAQPPLLGSKQRSACPDCRERRLAAR